MKERPTTMTARWGSVIAFFIFVGNGLAASENAPITREQFLLLQQQNQQLQQQLQTQQQLIDSLSRKVADIQEANSHHAQTSALSSVEEPMPPSSPEPAMHLGKVDITGE